MTMNKLSSHHIIDGTVYPKGTSYQVITEKEAAVNKNYETLLSSYVTVLKSKSDGYEFVAEKDMVWILPYIVSEDVFLVRTEYVPPYQHKADTKDLFFTAISGTIEEGEDHTATLFRELKEEAGIVPTKFTLFKPEFPVPVMKTVNSRAYIYVMDIEEYEQGEAVGDGSEAESKSKTIKVSPSDIESMILGQYNHDFIIEGLLRMYEFRK